MISSITSTIFTRPFILKNNSKWNIKYADCTARHANLGKQNEDGTSLTFEEGYPAVPLRSLLAGKSVQLDTREKGQYGPVAMYYSFRTSGYGAYLVASFYDIPIYTKLAESSASEQNSNLIPTL